MVRSASAGGAPGVLGRLQPGCILPLIHTERVRVTLRLCGAAQIWKQLLPRRVFTPGAAAQHSANNGEFSTFGAVLRCNAPCVGRAQSAATGWCTYVSCDLVEDDPVFAVSQGALQAAVRHRRRRHALRQLPRHRQVGRASLEKIRSHNDNWASCNLETSLSP